MKNEYFIIDALNLCLEAKKTFEINECKNKAYDQTNDFTKFKSIWMLKVSILGMLMAWLIRKD